MQSRKWNGRGTGPCSPWHLALTDCPWQAYCPGLDGPFRSSVSQPLTCSPGTQESYKADLVFLALSCHWLHASITRNRVRVSGSITKNSVLTSSPLKSRRVSWESGGRIPNPPLLLFLHHELCERRWPFTSLANFLNSLRVFAFWKTKTPPLMQWTHNWLPIGRLNAEEKIEGEKAL